MNLAPMQNNEPHGRNGAFISLTGVSKRYGERQVLDGVTASFEVGKTVALVGPSGGGKSTLLRLINGLCDFEAGEIDVGGHTLGPAVRRRAKADAVRQVRRKVGMVFQDFQLFPHMTAVDNVATGPRHVLGRPADEAEDTARELLARVGLADRANAYPAELSGGQKQRVAIARALAMRPQALLCDEITSALDPPLKRDVLAVLELLREEGITLVVVTHEIGFARRASDRVVVFDGGRIIEDGRPEEVIDNPRQPRTRAFLEHVLG